MINLFGKLILGLSILVLFTACSEQSEKEVKEVGEKIQNVDVQKVASKTKEAALEVIKNVKKTDVKKVIEQSVTKVKEVALKTVSKSGDIAKNIKKDVVQALNSVQKTPKASSIDGASLFASRCASCHGANAEKSALGQSKVIAKWSIAQVKIALNGYKDGSYGANMKMLMKNQASSLSDEQITALAEFVSKQ